MTILITSAVLLLMSSYAVLGQQVGTPLCTKNSQTGWLRSDFNLRLGPGETIPTVYGCVVNASNPAQLDLVSCNITSIDNVTESGQNVTYLSVRSIVNLENSSITENGCGITETTVNGLKAFSLILAIRKSAGAVNAGDANYRWTCIQDSATQLFISSQVQVQTSNLDQTLTPVVPIVSLKVVTEDSSSSTGYSVASTLNAGQSFSLLVDYDRPEPFTDFLTPWGVHMFNTYVGPSSGAINFPITTSDGCIVPNNILNVSTPFSIKPQQSNESQGIYQTGTGYSFRFGNSNELWFSTYVDFCSGVFREDQKCIDSCQTNARKKRQTNVERQLLTVKVTIINEEPESDESQSLKPMLIGLTVGVAVLLAIVVAIATYVFCFRGRPRTRSSKSRFSNSSYASSQPSIPPKY